MEVERRWICGDCGATEVAEGEPNRCECGSDRFWSDELDRTPHPQEVEDGD